MKQIYTLLTAIICTTFFTTKANAQNISTGFETQADFNQLVYSCWTFNNFSFTATAPISGTGSVLSTLNSAGEMITPELQIPSTLNINFSYNMVQANNGTKTLKIILLIGTTETMLQSINLQSNPSGIFTGSYTNANTPGNNINGNRKVIFRTTSNISVMIDDLSINAPYTYPGGCPAVNIPLPLKLTSFSGNTINNKVRLQWAVDENATGHHFEIEKSINGSSFQKEDIVFATEKQGRETYTYDGPSKLESNISYRMKLVNKDGSSSYSKVLAFSMQNDQKKNSLEMLQNPIYNTLSFTYHATGNGVYKVALYTPAGVKVFAKPVSMQQGSNTVSLSIDCSLPVGSYVMEVTGTTERITTMIIK